LRYCPKCRSEYQDWVGSCIDCGTSLVEQLPEMPETSNISVGSSSNPRTYTREKIVTIASYSQPEEAELVQAKLESEGIRSFIADGNFVSSYRLASVAVGGVRLQVRKSDAEVALQILNENSKEEQSPVENGIENATDTCPRCHSSDIQYETFALRRVFLAMLFLAPLPFLKRKWKCHRCGNEWK
jgi:hypothetical protein